MLPGHNRGFKKETEKMEQAIFVCGVARLIRLLQTPLFCMAHLQP